MAKTVKITIVDDENPDVPQVWEKKFEGGALTPNEWEEMMAFEDEHIGGRPNDRK